MNQPHKGKSTSRQLPPINSSRIIDRNADPAADVDGSIFGPVFDGYPPDGLFVINNDAGDSLLVRRDDKEIIVRPDWPDKILQPDERLRARDWSMASLIEEIGQLPDVKFLDCGDYVIAHDLYRRMFIITKPSSSFHPAAAGLTFQTSAELMKDLSGLLVIVVAGRWRRPALPGEWEPKSVSREQQAMVA